ncbi:MAG: hypothetical protein ACRDFX_06585, partial [Chloroflexota bacterium]
MRTVEDYHVMVLRSIGYARAQRPPWPRWRLDDLDNLESHVCLADIEPQAVLLLLAYVRDLRGRLPRVFGRLAAPGAALIARSADASPPRAAGWLVAFPAWQRAASR